MQLLPLRFSKKIVRSLMGESDPTPAEAVPVQEPVQQAPVQQPTYEQPQNMYSQLAMQQQSFNNQPEYQQPVQQPMQQPMQQHSLLH